MAGEKDNFISPPPTTKAKLHACHNNGLKVQHDTVKLIDNVLKKKRGIHKNLSQSLKLAREKHPAIHPAFLLRIGQDLFEEWITHRQDMWTPKSTSPILLLNTHTHTHTS